MQHFFHCATHFSCRCVLTCEGDYDVMGRSRASSKQGVCIRKRLGSGKWAVRSKKGIISLMSSENVENMTTDYIFQQVRHSCREVVWFGSLCISYLLFANDVLVLLASESWPPALTGVGSFQKKKKVERFIWIRGSHCLKWENLCIFESCSRVMVGWSRRHIDALGSLFAVMRALLRIVVVKKKLKGKTFNVPIYLCSSCHLSKRFWILAAERSFLWGLSLRDQVSSSIVRGNLN